MAAVIASWGPLGVFLLMVPESACVPVPSEVTLMSAGFAVHQGWFSLPAAVAAGTAGNLVGSLIAYWLGRRGALSRLRGRGRAAVATCERLFAARGDSAVLVARLLPLARSFVSLPAGHVRIPIGRFVALTVAGCAMWSLAFVLAGILAGAGWRSFANEAGKVGLLVGLVGIAALGLLSRRDKT